MVQKRNNLARGYEGRKLDLEIILVLLRGAAHLRQIARILSKSHTTVLRRINSLMEENALDYSREGKNKVFYVRNNQIAGNYAHSAELYKFSKLLKGYPELNIICADLRKMIPEGMIILFGSYAKGTAKQDSDIDIYAERAQSRQKNKIAETHPNLSVKSGVFDTKSLLIREIVKDHIIIRGVEEFYEKTGFFSEANQREEFRIGESF